MGGVEDYFREQKRMREALGLTATASTIAEANKATRFLSEHLGSQPRTLLSEIAEGRISGVTAYLRDQEAFSANTAAGILARNRVGTGVAETALALARQHQERFGGLNDRIVQQAIGAGFLSTSAIAAQALGTAAAIRQAELGAVTRAAHWATALQAHERASVAGLLGTSATIDRQLDRITAAAAGIVDAGGLAAHAAREVELSGLRTATALKMSAFAGSLDLIGPRSAVGQAAFDALLGTWHTRSDLPVAFWRDPATRRQTYRDAEVDPGLIDADNAALVEVLVDSGLVEGTVTPTGVRAVVEVGPLRMSITARHARHDAFRVIDGFEVALRAFIAAKLEAHLTQRGEDASKWFTLRVPGNIVGEAKKTRRDAYHAGEPKQALINFTNLGDLIAVVSSTRNWDEVFGQVFADRDGFKVDLQRLNAHRRPAMHARPIDGPRLAEIILTVRRLMAMMQADGSWVSGWDDDV